MHKFLALLVGVIAGFLGTGLTARIGGLLYPVRADPQIADRVTQLREAMASAPVEAQMFIAASFFVGGFVAALFAKLISRANWPGMAAAAVVALAAVLVVLVLPLPGWIQAGAVILPLVGGMIGNQLVRSRSGEPVAAAPADG